MSASGQGDCDLVIDNGLNGRQQRCRPELSLPGRAGRRARAGDEAVRKLISCQPQTSEAEVKAMIGAG